MTVHPSLRVWLRVAVPYLPHSRVSNQRVIISMKLFVLTALLLSALFVQAQTSGAQYSNRRSADLSYHSAPLSELQQSYDRKEGQLQQLLSSYDQLPQGQQPQARQQARTLLYELFDLAIAQKKQEAELLQRQVARLEKDPSYQGRTEDLQRLRQRLEQIESNLGHRAHYRDQIVSQRLSELL